MNNDNFLKKLIQKIFPRQRGQQPGPDKEMQVRLNNLLQMVEDTDETELSCDEVFELLDQYVEMVVHKENAEYLLPLVKKHLDRCKDCDEEFKALVSVIEGTAALDS